MTDFGAGIEEVNDRIMQGKGISALQEPFHRYLSTVKEGTDSKPQRVRREHLLRDVLDGVFEPLDANRTFDATQRRVLWHALVSKECRECGELITRWEDLSIDHIQPYIKRRENRSS